MAQRCTRTLVVNVQGGNGTLGDDPGVETARRARVHASAEDQLHLAWSTDVEAFTNDLLEEQPACRWPVEHLSQGNSACKIEIWYWYPALRSARE